MVGPDKLVIINCSLSSGIFPPAIFLIFTSFFKLTFQSTCVSYNSYKVFIMQLTAIYSD